MPAPELLTPVYGFSYNLFIASPVWNTGIALALLLAGALYLNFLLSNFGLTPKKSYFTAFIYIVLMSCSTHYLTLHPVLIGNIVIMMLLKKVFIANQKEDALKEIFAAGIFAAIASLVDVKSAGLLVAIWFFLIILRVFNGRQWAVSIIGFGVVYLYLFSYYLFTDQLLSKVSLYRTVLSSIEMVKISVHLTVYEYILIGLLLTALLFSMVNFLFTVSEKLISIRRISMILLWFLFASIASVLSYLTNPVFDFAFLLLPISIMMALYFSNIKRSLLGEILLLLILISIYIIRI